MLSTFAVNYLTWWHIPDTVTRLLMHDFHASKVFFYFIGKFVLLMPEERTNVPKRIFGERLFEHEKMTTLD